MLHQNKYNKIGSFEVFAFDLGAVWVTFYKKAIKKPPGMMPRGFSLGGSGRLLLRLNSFVIRETVAEDILVCLVVELTSSNLVGLVALIDRHRGA